MYHASTELVETPEPEVCERDEDMTEGRQTILQMKYARIIRCMSEMYGLTLEEAMNRFYTSRTLEFIREGVSDLHCRSDKYLADEVMMEK